MNQLDQSDREMLQHLSMEGHDLAEIADRSGCHT